jgi:hypothetical protein
MTPITIDPNSQSASVLNPISGGWSPIIDNSTSLFNSGATTWPP